jgi:hypothetical protein
MRTIPRTTILVAGLAALSACASTRFDTTWRDPTYEGRPFAKVLVVGSTDNAGDRRIFEDAVASEWWGRGSAPSTTDLSSVSRELGATIVKSLKSAKLL